MLRPKLTPSRQHQNPSLWQRPSKLRPLPSFRIMILLFPGLIGFQSRRRELTWRISWSARAAGTQVSPAQTGR